MPSSSTLSPSSPSTTLIRPPPKSDPLSLSLISGSFAGAFQVLVGQPLDTVKTRAQTAPPGKFKGPWDVCVQTVKGEGFRAFYKGMASPLMGVAAVNSLLFTSFAVSKRILSPYPNLDIYQTAAAGGMAGGVNALLASPVEMFKVRMQAQYGSPTDKTLRTVVSETWNKWGVRQGIMRGFWITFVREVPAYAAFYASYEYLKRTIARRLHPDWDPSSLLPASGGPSASTTSSSSSSIEAEQLFPQPMPTLPVWALVVSGAGGGVGYWLASYPLDIVKSNVQLADSPPTRGYILRELQGIVTRDGWKGLFRGLSPTLIRAVPAAASTFVAFEISRDLLLKSGAF